MLNFGSIVLEIADFLSIDALKSIFHQEFKEKDSSNCF
ncbi:MAG: hypothetical protein PG977_000189 [Bartonella clarridgeiae]|nr:MAG: hypothetical protein PG977_000189 [Bartonella clarridgeiae]